MRIPIRCCCSPRLVLGTVDVHESVTEGSVVMLRDRLSARWVGEYVHADNLVLTVAVYHEHGQGWTPEMVDAYAGTDERCQLAAEQLALRSDDVSIERLRKVEGFIEINRPLRIGES